MVADNALDAAPLQFVAAFVHLGIIADHVAHAEDLGDAHAIDSARTAFSASKFPWMSEMNAIVIEDEILGIADGSAALDVRLDRHPFLDGHFDRHQGFVVAKGGADRRG